VKRAQTSLATLAIAASDFVVLLGLLVAIGAWLGR
jgi:hypothetical protein